MPVRPNHTAVVFVLPAGDSSFRERHAPLLAELAKPEFTVSQLMVGEGAMSLEQVAFLLSNEMHETDVIILSDAQAGGYDFVDLAARCVFHLPAAKVALIAGQPEHASPAVFERAKFVHFTVAAADSAVLSKVRKGAVDGTDARLHRNDALILKQARVEEVVTSYSRKNLDGGFSEVRLNTPVAPRTLPVEETVAAVMARPRVTGRVLLVVPSQFNVYGARMKPVYPPLGVMWVAAMLEKAGHRCEIVDMDADGVNLPGLLRRIDQHRYDVLGLTAVTPTYPNALEIANAVKRQFPRLPTMLGGIHATTDPMKCARESAFNFVAVGEAEVTAVELVDAIMAKAADLSSIPGLVYRDRSGQIVSSGARTLVPDLDDYPYPAIHLIGGLDRYAPAHATAAPVAPIMVSRGCPGACTYCQTKNIFGRRTRFRSPQNVIGEIRRLVYDHGVKELHFLDDVITANKKFVREFCALLAQEPYKLHIEVANGLRADMVNEEILTALRSVGLRNVGFGIESGNDRVLKIVKKGITKDQVRRAVRIAKDLGLETWGFFMIGLPGDDEASIRDTIDFALELDTKYAKFLFMKPYPGSEAYYQLEEKGLIDSRDYSAYGPYRPPAHHLEGVPAARLMELRQEAWRRFYLRPEKIVEHLVDLRSLGQLRSLVRGASFVVQQLFNTGSGTA